VPLYGTRASLHLRHLEIIYTTTSEETADPSPGGHPAQTLLAPACAVPGTADRSGRRHVRSVDQALHPIPQHPSSQGDWRRFAWVLLDNHFHVFLRMPHADLSAGKYDLNAGCVSRFNRRHRRSGPLLHGRFKGVLVEEGHHYWELSRYIHLNPCLRRVASR